MKKPIILSLAAILTTVCKGQENKEDQNLHKDSSEQMAEQPKGTGKIDKEFDENRNLFRYDSIYFWSSSDNLGDLKQKYSDSFLPSLRSKFYRI